MDNRRRAPRYGVDVEGIIRGEGGEARKVAISNLSVEGCRMSAPGRRFAAGTLLFVVGVAVFAFSGKHARLATAVSVDRSQSVQAERRAAL